MPASARYSIVQLACLFFLLPSITAQQFSFGSKENPVAILYSKESVALDSIAAHLLSEDINRVTGYTPVVVTDINKAKGSVIVIGNIESAMLQKFVNNNTTVYKGLVGKWECYALKIVQKPFKHISDALIIAGSDTRGTAYGVFSLSEKIGVSPWYWWADVAAKQNKSLRIQQPEFISAPPSVRYRGIFINDEDWGLLPWAAETFEPEKKNIGPKTYAKVFELLLRLKANLIWPGMHPGTRPFFTDTGNAKMAADYSIVVGTSHAEPMLRNNVGEWNEKTMGHFNYLTNKPTVYQYWEDRLKQITGQDVIFTMGMRGVHDSGMEGVKDPKDAVPLLEQIIKDQRGLLQKYYSKPVDSVAQAFTAYKEVLDIYDKGLKLPEDITLVWPDDNYGYIQRLSTEEEKKRNGGSGVYYHASYWGRPHDYLWLATAHPSLIREEMVKAYRTGADKIWVLNIGDIKPQEYNIQHFLDMAYDVKPFLDSRYTRLHLAHWIKNIFGGQHSDSIQKLLWKYYELAFERKPEFMGWSRTEPTTKTAYTEYNHFFHGDEAQKRIDQYQQLQQGAEQISRMMPRSNADAFYELVYYPIKGSSLINKKFLYRDKAYYYSKQNRLSAFDYASLSKSAYDSIQIETVYFNKTTAKGKWNKIMSSKPRDLPVFHSPTEPGINIDSSVAWSISPEGLAIDSTQQIRPQTFTLPPFDNLNQQQYFVDIFLSARRTIAWKAIRSMNWITLSKTNGVLSPGAGKNQVRLLVSVDWKKVSSAGKSNGVITIKADGNEYSLQVNASNYSTPGQAGAFIENNGIVSMRAFHYTREIKTAAFNWKQVEGLGYAGTAIQSTFETGGDKNITTDTTSIMSNHPRVEYDFYTNTAASPTLHIYSIPTHPLNNKYSMRYAVSIDDGPVTIADFKTVGRSEEWKQNVLSNRARRAVKISLLQKGKHTLKIYAVDPAVIIDEIVIDLGGLKPAYSSIEETRSKL